MSSTTTGGSVDAGENAQNPIDSNARSRPGSSS